MKVSVLLSLLGVSFQIVAAAPAKHQKAAESKPSVFLLAGDSTTATQAANGGGKLLYTSPFLVWAKSDLVYRLG